MEPTLVWHTSGFVLFDEMADEEPMVHLELLTRGVNIDVAGQVNKYRAAFENLANASLVGGAARRLITEAAEALDLTA
jgi:Domain of unknown function (DUF5753)